MLSNTLIKMEKCVRIFFFLLQLFYFFFIVNFKGPANWKKGSPTMKPDMKADATKNYW